MNYSSEVLSEAAKEGSANVSLALSKLAQKEVLVGVSQIETIPISETLERIKPEEEHSVVVYAQITTGIPGISLMTISREDALKLVDILTQQPIGSSGILKDIDRSAIKEMLNILSNSYITALAKKSQTTLGVGIPNIITSERLDQIISSYLQSKQFDSENVVLFKTILEVNPLKIKTSLYFIFDEKLVNMFTKEI